MDERSITIAIAQESFNVLAEHAKNYDSGLAPDGSAQKQNSPAYAKRKSTKGILVGGSSKKVGQTTISKGFGKKVKVGGKRQRVGGTYQRGSQPTILTGDMKNSLALKVSPKRVNFIYEGSSKGNIANAKKANFLVKKGYKLNYLSDKNIDSVLKAVADEVEKLLKKAITQK